MTENKRFKLKYINEQHISANLYDNGTFIGAIGIGEELIVELLNDLADENEQLKEQLKTRVIVNKQYEELQRLKKENEQLKQYIYDNLDEDICDVCSYQYLEKSQMDKYYVARCKKGYDNCSKGTVIHCKDFKFKELQE